METRLASAIRCERQLCSGPRSNRKGGIVPGFEARLIAAVLSMVIASCSPRSGIPDVGSEGADPVVAVEHFLQLAHGRDFSAMGHLFGAVDGPILLRDPVVEVERRMYALADLLAHDAYSVRSGTAVPGRGGAAMTIPVTLMRGERSVEFPITVVRTRSGRWLVEQIDVSALAGG